jgi:hypothetical protein
VLSLRLDSEARAVEQKSLTRDVPVEGPVAGLDEQVHELHRRRFG